jgi:hypothetical protein
MKERSRTLPRANREERSPGESLSRKKCPKVAPEPVGEQVGTRVDLSARTGRPGTAVTRAIRFASFGF